MTLVDGMVPGWRFLGYILHFSKSRIELGRAFSQYDMSTLPFRHKGLWKEAIRTPPALYRSSVLVSRLPHERRAYTI